MRLRRFGAATRNESGPQSRVTCRHPPVATRAGPAACAIAKCVRHGPDTRNAACRRTRGIREAAAATAIMYRRMGRIMKTEPPIPRAILVGVQLPGVDDVAHAADIEELGRLVKTLGYEVIGTISQKRDEIDGGTVLGKGRLEELAAITGGTGVVGSMAIPRKSKARERFEDADERKPDAPGIEPDPDAPPKPEFVIVDHEISPSQARNLERATGALVLDRTGVIVEIFHRHAHSREAKLQVEMARLKYVSPRLRESSAGGGRQQGPGAGESDLALDRRKVRDR